MIDSSSLFLHVLAAVGMVGGGIVQVMAGFRVRAAADGAQVSTAEISSWARFARSAGLLIVASAVVSLLTGGHLAGAVWTTEEVSGFSYPFITLGVVGLVLLAPVGPMIGGARLRRLAAMAEEGADRATLRAAASDPRLWGPVHSLIGVGVGLIALMTYKPSWAVSGVILLVTFALGWASGHALAGRTPAAATQRV